ERQVESNRPPTVTPPLYLPESSGSRVNSRAAYAFDIFEDSLQSLSDRIIFGLPERSPVPFPPKLVVFGILIVAEILVVQQSVHSLINLHSNFPSIIKWLCCISTEDRRKL